MRTSVCFTLALLAILAPLAARAQEPGAATAAAPKAPSGYVVTLGGFGALAPRFEGARRRSWGIVPLFDVRDAGDKEWLNLPRDGIDYAIFETDAFRVGVVVNFRWERDTNSLIRGYRHVGDVNLSLEGGLFAELWPAQWLRTRVEAREAVLGATGLTADLSADLVMTPMPALTWTAGPRLSLGDKRFMTSYYGVDSAQSARSGLSEYKADPGIRSVGAGSMLRYRVTETFSALAFVEYQRLSDVALDSPLITRKGSPNQTTIGIGSSINFSIGD